MPESVFSAHSSLKPQTSTLAGQPLSLLDQELDEMFKIENAGQGKVIEVLDLSFEPLEFQNMSESDVAPSMEGQSETGEEIEDFHGDGEHQKVKSRSVRTRKPASRYSPGPFRK